MDWNVYWHHHFHMLLPLGWWGGIEVVFMWMNHPFVIAKIRLRRYIIVTPDWPVGAWLMVHDKASVISLFMCV
jgi:hypothetical protein